MAYHVENIKDQYLQNHECVIKKMLDQYYKIFNCNKKI